MGSKAPRPPAADETATENVVEVRTLRELNELATGEWQNAQICVARHTDKIAAAGRFSLQVNADGQRIVVIHDVPVIPIVFAKAQST